MHLLFLTHYFPPEGNAPASRVFELARRWVKAGHKVTVITCAPNVPNGVVYEGYRNRLWSSEEMAGIRVIRVWTFLAPNKGTVKRILNYLSFLCSACLASLCLPRPDLVLATSPQFFCGWAGAIVSVLRRRPFILEVRDIWPESIETVGALRRGFLIRCLEWLELRLYAAADHIVTVGEGYRQKLLQRGVAGSRLSIVSNGVDTDVFAQRPRPDSLRGEYGLQHVFVCSYVGTVGMACGLEIVLRAASILRQRGRDDIKFMIVGDGALLDELKDSTVRQGLTNVLFTGRQPKERIPDFLAASDACLVHLRKQELFATVMPSKLFEALGMGRPVILGVAGCAAELLAECGGGICIEPENERALLQAIDRLRLDRAWAESAGRRGRDYVLARFNREALAERYLEVLRRHANGSTPVSTAPCKMPDVEQAQR